MIFCFNLTIVQLLAAVLWWCFSMSDTRVNLSAYWLHLEGSPKAWVQQLPAVQSSLHLLAAAPAAAALHCIRGWRPAALLEGHQLPASQP